MFRGLDFIECRMANMIMTVVEEARTRCTSICRWDSLFLVTKLYG